jgi:hypothetical protein
MGIVRISGEIFDGRSVNISELTQAAMPLRISETVL